MAKLSEHRLHFEKGKLYTIYGFGKLTDKNLSGVATWIEKNTVTLKVKTEYGTRSFFFSRVSGLRLADVGSKSGYTVNPKVVIKPPTFFVPKHAENSKIVKVEEYAKPLSETAKLVVQVWRQPTSNIEEDALYVKCFRSEKSIAKKGDSNRMITKQLPGTIPLTFLKSVLDRY